MLFLSLLYVYWIRFSYGFDNNHIIVLKVKIVSAQIVFINKVA